MTAIVAGSSDWVSPHADMPAASILNSPRTVQVLRVMWGVVCLAFPAVLAADVDREVPDRRAVRVIQVLGVRHVVQGIVSALVPSGRVLVCGAFVDGLHSASMVAFGVADPQRRRLAWTDGVIAAGWGILTFRSAHRASPSAG